jgi:hypothetical protein
VRHVLTIDPPTAAQPRAIALALERIEALRAAGFELIAPDAPDELARLRRGAELVIVRADRASTMPRGTP